ncbi:MAG: 4Fe-4S binding protein [bacterium]|nr:4Fe-4S binding protein [bacterium]
MSPLTTVNFTINGIQVKAEKGTPLIQSASKLGIPIPALCTYEHMEPYGACRLCVVELHRGNRSRLVTACNYPASEGIAIVTDSPRVQRARKMNLEFLLGQNANVPVIQDLAKQYGITESRFGKEPGGCILCGLCVRICDEVVGAHALTFAHTGCNREVAVPFNKESDACIACGACAFVCPTGYIKVEDYKNRKIVHSELTLGPKTPIYVPTLQSVPNVPVIDKESCIHFKTGKCKICAKICESRAIDHTMQDKTVEIEVGTAIIATGFKPFDPSVLTQYGYGKYDNVLTALEFERLNCAAGPTGGKVLMTNGEPPKSIAILHCIGSRDKQYNEYCSRVCCMYALKFAHLVKEKTNAEVYDLYLDLRCFGKGYEEFYHRLLEEDVRFIRGKGAEVSDFAIYPGEKGKLIVRVEDTLLGLVRRIPVDMVVLCTALEAAENAKEIARMFSISQGKDRFFIEKHPKLGPVATNTDGIFIAGVCQGPKDIPDTVAQGSAAAAAVLSLIMKGSAEIESAVSVIDPDLCSGCKICNELCPYAAILFNADKKISEINEALCKGCGTCAAACPSGAITARHFTTKQIMSEIEGVLL